ncbi:MAG: VTT domain-containing protein [bacterium]
MEEMVLVKDGIEEFLNNWGILSPIISSILILLESFIPILPLFLFVSINIVVLGNVGGFLLSYIMSIISSYLAFLFFRRKVSIIFKDKLKKTHEQINKLNFIKTTLILSMPYTPGSMVNFALGLGKMENKEYLLCLIISKFFVILFWGYVGTSLFESLNDPSIILILIITLIMVYFICKFIEKNIEREKKNE